MLFLLFGSSAAGKTAALTGLRERLPELPIHDFDGIHVPSDADTAWRQRANEDWLRRVLDEQTGGRDFVLAGQTPFGEVLAAPSAVQLEGLSACLLDCNDDVRLERIHERGSAWIERVPGKIQDHLNWAEWMRHHALDPRWRQDVIRAAGAGGMRWERWTGWRAGDPRWRVRVIDTSEKPADQVADELRSWIESERGLLRLVRHPLGATALRHLSLAPKRP